MKKLTLVIIFALLAAFFCSVPSGAFSNRVLDKAGIISAEDEARIESTLSSFEARHNIHIRVVTYTGSSSAGWYFSELGLSRGDDLIVIAIDRAFGEYYYYLDTYGAAYDRISDSEVDRILDGVGVYDNIKSARFADGVEACVSLLSTACDGRLQEPVWQTVLISLLIASVIAGGVSGAVIYRYKKKLKSKVYPLERYARLDLDEAECSDMFIGSYVRRVRISSNTSGGGRSSGGGGGRRGGR